MVSCHNFDVMLPNLECRLFNFFTEVFCGCISKRGERFVRRKWCWSSVEKWVIDLTLDLCCYDLGKYM